GKEVLVSFASFFRMYVRHRFAGHFYDLKIVVVQPDSPLEISLALLKLFWCNVKHIGVQVIFLLFSLIQHVVFRQFIRAQCEMQAALDVVLIFWADGNRRLRRKHYVLNFLSALIKGYVGNLLVFADRFVPIELLDLDNLPVGTTLANALEFFFFGSEFLD